MKTGAKLRTLSVEEAQAALERAARKLIQRAQWVNPYSVMGRQYKATIYELKQPLAELSVARRASKSRD